MTTKLGIKEFLWMAIGASFLLVAMLIVLHFQRNENSTEQLAFKVKRLDLVARMRLTLTSASEAEKSAVMAITDQDSKTFADQSREATAEVEQDRNKLEKLLVENGTQSERDSLVEFSKAFTELKRIDDELLDLAIRNTNIKAYSLAFGPAADVLKEMDNALSTLVTKSDAFPEARNVTLLAFGAQASALRIQTLLAPHIAEESDKKMDDLELLMTKEDTKVRKNLGDLAALRKFQGDPDLELALSDYARFSDIRSHILALSRENSNVRSLAMSLGQKRKILFLCQDALSALQQAIMEEHIGGVNYMSISNPRSLQIEK